jgi:hypothetical protein
MALLAADFHGFKRVFAARVTRDAPQFPGPSLPCIGSGEKLGR